MSAALVVLFAARAFGLPEAEVRTLTFSAMVLTNLMLIVTNRSLTRSSLIEFVSPNPILLALVGGTVLLLLVVIYVPLPRELLRLATPHPIGLAACALVSAVAIGWMEAVKRMVRN